MKKVLTKKLALIPAAALGMNLAICGVHWYQWQYWALFGNAFVWAAVAYWEGLEAQKAD